MPDLKVKGLMFLFCPIVIQSKQPNKQPTRTNPFKHFLFTRLLHVSGIVSAGNLSITNFSHVAEIQQLVAEGTFDHIGGSDRRRPSTWLTRTGEGTSCPLTIPPHSL